MNEDDIVYRLKKRAEIRRAIPRGEPDRISDVLEEAAKTIEYLQEFMNAAFEAHPNLDLDIEATKTYHERTNT